MCHFLKSTIGALFPLPIISICHFILGLFFLAPYSPVPIFQATMESMTMKGFSMLLQTVCHITCIWRCLVVLLCHFHGCLIVRCLNVRCLNVRCLNVRCLNARCLVVRGLVVLDSFWLTTLWITTLYCQLIDFLLLSTHRTQKLSISQSLFWGQ